MAEMRCALRLSPRCAQAQASISVSMFGIDPMDLPHACCPETSHAQHAWATAIDAVAIGAETNDCVLLLLMRVMAGFLGGLETKRARGSQPATAAAKILLGEHGFMPVAAPRPQSALAIALMRLATHTRRNPSASRTFRRPHPARGAAIPPPPGAPHRTSAAYRRMPPPRRRSAAPARGRRAVPR